MRVFYKRLFSTLLACCFFICNGQQVIETTAKPDPSVDYKKLSNIDTLINGYISRKGVNGLVTIIVKDGKIIQNKGYGYSDVASKKLMQPNSIFRIASQTKAIVSAGILVLFDEGKISLSDPFPNTFLILPMQGFLINLMLTIQAIQPFRQAKRHHQRFADTYFWYRLSAYRNG